MDTAYTTHIRTSIMTGTSMHYHTGALGLAGRSVGRLVGRSVGRCGGWDQPWSGR